MNRPIISSRELYALLSQVIEFPPNLVSATIKFGVDSVVEVECSYHAVQQRDVMSHVPERKRFVLVPADAPESSLTTVKGQP